MSSSQLDDVFATIDGQQATAGIVGTGDIAVNHAEAYAANGVKLVAACDINPANLARFTQRFPGIRTYASAAEMMQAETELSLVSICTPPFVHLENVLAVLEAGSAALKGILCEKPPTLKSSDLEQMIAAAEEHGVVLTFGFHLMFAVGWLQRLIAGGGLGEIQSVDLMWLRRLGMPSRGVFTKKELSGGGPGWDLLPHMLSVGLGLLKGAEPVAVTAVGHYGIARKGGLLNQLPPKNIDVETSLGGFLTLVYPGREDPVSMSFRTAWDSHIRMDVVRVEIQGTDGGAIIDLVQEGGQEWLVPTVYTTIAGRPVDIAVPRVEGAPGLPTVDECYALEVGDLLKAVQGVAAGQEPAPVNGAHGARQVVSVIETTYKSVAQRGRQLPVSS